MEGGQPVRRLFDEIAVVGWACRFPGARSVSELWSVLVDGRCTVTEVPRDRFPLDRYGHVRRQERGKSYTWAAGVLDSVFDFDPHVFGISPREAEQMDPQQRLLLELTWEALEDSGIPPSRIAGKDVGVFVGASLTDYGNILSGDPAVADAQFATGNALAILSNRISYIFDLHGPSLTIDTACSSSLVALHHAVEALRSGRIDTAIVGGVNIIASPVAFITFSQASMLSPTGRCRAFSDDADGFVRAEGGAVLVLRKAALAQREKNPLRGFVLASDVNSDGRTSGILLPSGTAQEDLLARVYARAGIPASRLAFVEAHGTGTAAGDPIEANAIGRSLGRFRNGPLPIGSIKTNIGHLEPASGIAGVIKGLLSLHHGILPQSLHFKAPNPRIDFHGLNLRTTEKPILLPDAAAQCAGVNSFGFGGTNAHVVLAPGRPLPREEAEPSKYFFISARSGEALCALASEYRSRISEADEPDVGRIAAAAALQRDHLEHRLIVPLSSKQRLLESLDRFIAGDDVEGFAAGEVAAKDMPVAFVYSGNGGQWAGMGVAAYNANTVFRESFDKVDRIFSPLAGWSLREMMFSGELSGALERTSVAQPLIFAVQVAATEALRRSGVHPSVVLGHSVGEVAAAYASGALDLKAAVKLIFHRSKHQEAARGLGRMAALSCTPDQAAHLIAGCEGVEIAAFNSSHSVTIAGATEALDQVKGRARGEAVAMLDLGLDYPFHTAALDSSKDGLARDLQGLSAVDGLVPFLSTVTGRSLPGSRLNAHYWWRNVREPVQFERAVQEAAREGARCFVEIGPRGILVRHIADTLKDQFDPVFCCESLSRDTGDEDPFPAILGRILLAGGKVNPDDAFGGDPGGSVPLPHYPWQRQHYRFTQTVEAHGTFEVHRSRYAGARYSQFDSEWHVHFDTAALPELADHRVGEQTIFPGTGFLDIALSVAREFLRTDHVVISDFEVLKPLDLSAQESRHVMTRVSAASGTLEIMSRLRLAEGEWLLNCRCKIGHGRRESDEAASRKVTSGDAWSDAEEVYRLTRKHGLHYGPAFRQLARARRNKSRLLVQLDGRPSTEGVSLDPMQIDACSHAVLLVFDELRAGERGVTYIPVRIDEVALFQPGAATDHAVIDIVSRNERSIVVNYAIFARDGRQIARLTGVRAQAIPVRRPLHLDSNAAVEIDRPVLSSIRGLPISSAAIGRSDTKEPEQSDLILDAWAIAAIAELLGSIAGEGLVNPARIMEQGRWPKPAEALLLLMIDRLCAAGFAVAEVGGWRLVEVDGLPSAAEMLRDLEAACSDRARDLLACSAITHWLGSVRSKGRIEQLQVISEQILAFQAVVGIGSRRRAASLIEFIDKSAVWPADRTLHILHLGFGAGTPALVANLRNRGFKQAVFEPDSNRVDDISLQQMRGIEIVPSWPKGEFDLILSIDGLSEQGDLAALHALLTPEGRIIAAEAQPNAYEDLVTGLSSATPAIRRSLQQWADLLTGAGFTEVATQDIGSGDQIIAARSGKVVEEALPPALSFEVVAHDCSADFSGRVRKMLRRFAVDESKRSQTLYLLPDRLDTADELADTCMALKAFAEGQANHETKVWIVFRGGRDTASNRAIWTFTRVLANEFSNLDVRRVWLSDAQPDLDTLAAFLAAQSFETDFIVEQGVARALRVEPLSALARQNKAVAEAARLERRLDIAERAQWMPAIRRAPANHEVEIQVEATGLNFRDVMWTSGLLPDDILEDGFAGPTLGLECAGRILRTGSKIRHLKAGDRVVGFIPSAFSTHVTVPATCVTPVPHGLTAQAAATIPVAFLTAYYGLITLGKLRKREWVLIHAAAGAVGLAAIQVAQAQGARIIATAGSPAKRAMLKALGIVHVLDSRSLDFVDEIRHIRPGGVDVVLNSLAGEAMERSIRCLRPFGRFIELGKRDYAANTHIGLRPFSKNVSYFGVDVDQLVGHQAALGRKVFHKIMQGFEAGKYRPLPHSVFPADDTLKAFAVMRAGFHVGKIVVTPPASVPAEDGAFAVSAEKTHLVTGGLAGFGLATARWLVDQGARYLVVMSRSGPSTEEAKRALEEFRQRGVNVLAASCDVSNEVALKQLFNQIAVDMPPICGVMHAAMVLDDALIGNLNRERFLKVLAPKMSGALHLHNLTRDMSLDYFVLFSSVTTLFGNPGQGNYVLANGYLEGLARMRRSAGLPALAVGFGAISDVGVVARSRSLQDNLSGATGARGMTSAEALELMKQALQRFGNDPAVAAVAISPTSGAFSFDRLSVLRSPTFAAFVSDAAGGGDAVAIDLARLLGEKGIEEARETVIGLVAGQVARVLRAKEETLSWTRALTEMGLDSLMALELGMNLEKTFGIDIPLTVSAADLTIAKLGDRILALASRGQIGPDEHADRLVAPHLKDARPEQIDALGEIIAARKSR